MSDDHTLSDIHSAAQAITVAAPAEQNHDFLARLLEAALLAAGDALTLERMGRLFDEADMPPAAELLAALELLKARCSGRGMELVEVASGWRLQVREEYAPWINRLWEEKPQKYSRAMLETLALIAYRQPITRGDIEGVRGVTVSSHIIKTLAEREWIKIVGQRDVPGRPALYATTRQFLDYFNLKSLEELPSLSELKDIDGPNQSLDLQTAEQVPPHNLDLNLMQENNEADNSTVTEVEPVSDRAQQQLLPIE